MDENNIPNINPQEIKHRFDDLQKEIFDLQKSELTHLELEFENYKNLYPNNNLKDIKSSIH